MTNDLSQCGNCIYHYTYNGRDMCKQVGDDFYLQWKVEDCPYHTTITSATKISDEIYRLRAENAALRERLDKAVELPCKIGDKVYMPWVYDGISGIAEITVCSVTVFDGEYIYDTDLESDDIDFKQEYSYGQFRDYDFGTKVFTTREAAEVRLAELKGEKK